MRPSTDTRLKFSRGITSIVYTYSYVWTNRESDVFTAYVEDLFKIKSTTTNPTEKATTKSLLNNLLGRFGLNIYKGVTKLVNTNSEYYNRLVQTVEITSFIPIGDYAIISYVNKISREVTDSFDIDFPKAVVASIKGNEAGENTYRDVSVKHSLCGDFICQDRYVQS